MKKPLIVILTDTHLHDENADIVFNIFQQAVARCLELNLKTLHHAGDIFESRKAQTLKTLLAFHRILKMLEEAGIVLLAIPGNHDKPSYTHEDSYLDVYAGRSNFEVVRDSFTTTIGPTMTLHMVPFFKESENYQDYLMRVMPSLNQMPGMKHYLITHIAIDGVINNDGSKVKDHIPAGAFKTFEKVFVGHYHDAQQIGDNIFYIGAGLQKNYGENEAKGVTVLYDDGTHEQLTLDFVKYKVHHINLDDVDLDELETLRLDNSNPEDNVRFKLYGPKEKLQAVDKKTFLDVGIDVKTKVDDVDAVDVKEVANFESFTDSAIIEEFSEFCKENNYVDPEVGEKYLKLALDE